MKDEKSEIQLSEKKVRKNRNHEEKITNSEIRRDIIDQILKI
jgi:hypothetical protein